MPQFGQIVDMTQVLQYATNMFQTAAPVFYLVIGTSFAFFVLGGLLALFIRRKQGYD